MPRLLKFEPKVLPSSLFVLIPDSYLKAQTAFYPGYFQCTELSKMGAE